MSKSMPTASPPKASEADRTNATANTVAASSESRPRPGPAERPQQPKAEHGYRNEVSWRGGQGRQPYTNQDPGAPHLPSAMPEAEQGDRGAHSGVNQQQMRDVRGKP